MKVEIRSAHPFGFRNGTWAEILSVDWKNNRPCYKVMFPEDRFVDWWPVNDEWDPYEFRQGPDLRGRDYPSAGDGLSRWSMCKWRSPEGDRCLSTESEHDGSWAYGHPFDPVTGQNSQN